MRNNYTIRDEIQEYWSKRAATFDLQPGHEIFSQSERTAWQDLLIKHLGRGDNRKALDLACGTGVISHLMNDIGFDVTGIDWSDAMLSKARQKSSDRQTDIAFFIGDAERTGENDGSYDVIVMRHLVWTLVDPQTAFAHWFSLLKPGGKLLIVDGDFVNNSIAARLVKTLRIAFEGKHLAGPLAKSPEMQAIHQSILSQVYFSNGAKAKDIAAMLKHEGFENINVQTRLTAIHRAQSSQMGLLKFLERSIQNRYAICAVKPVVPE
ncbi:MAG: class I SAM-dependent methyltransferase [Cohaesibacteraceae bacterium]|nr:class I SAM-dependent methyltransferase [Cohaesibacteraceae bacterium]MBL4875457.1 class I SAM-dependent methyltransferase [Cohaesibacteraceae bacterium]